MSKRKWLFLFFYLFFGVAFWLQIGWVFTITWGEDNFFKYLIIFMWSFPINWLKMDIFESSYKIILVLNTIIWSLIIEGFVFLVNLAIVLRKKS